MHAVDWLIENARFKRAVYSRDLRRALAREKKHCTWCGEKITNARIHWCSDECVTAFKERCDPAHIRWKIQQRDKGVCALCGTDTEAIKKRFTELYYRAKEHARCHSFVRLMKLGRRYRLGSCATPWEADHIVPVVEGGGCCGLDGYRTLCIPCHKRESAALAARRAESRKALSGQSVIQFT